MTGKELRYAIMSNNLTVLQHELPLAPIDRL